MQVSINWLSENLQMHGATVRKRITNLERDKRGKVNLRAACEAIFGIKIGSNGHNGEFVSTPEANRRLIIAKEAEIALDMEIKRGDRIPREDCENALSEVVQAINGTLKAKRNQLLDDLTINEIFGHLREVGEKMK